MEPLPIRFVLVETSHPGNIGAVARAMKTMRLDQLYLVAPLKFPHADASARASGADDLLAAATVCTNLDEALAGCGLVLGTSARLRSVPWPVVSPREAAARAVREAADHPVAIVFGREKAGLANPEMDRCHALVNIPANPDYSSLNLAMAAQILAYELIMSRQHVEPARRIDDTALATADEMDYFYAHLEEVMTSSKFLDPDNPKHLMRRLRRLFNRARPDKNEINILRGILTAVTRHPPQHEETK